MSRSFTRATRYGSAQWSSDCSTGKLRSTRFTARSPPAADGRPSCGVHDMKPSMSLRGNQHDIAVAKSLLQQLRQQRTKLRKLTNRDVAKRLFEDTEIHHNPKRKPGTWARSNCDFRDQAAETGPGKDLIS